ncbi:nose resistant to fluoxetine protein 6 [Caerostris darwini]|uniref:Nose resistant to fluoxetine protein 6 n=1 Tax=Caerostris darwini TaxID=1538125 RepID=A0AAV4UE78_9ARAC|nr:nose resistant to fluoxetine protein 6 [Caerostris darwini]
MLFSFQCSTRTSKLPPGVLQGTFADYGSFDECLAVEGPGARFKGQSCALEARPPLPPLRPDYTLVKAHLNGNNGTLGGYFRVTYEALHHKKLRMVACVPSACSLQDMKAIARWVSNETDFNIKVPQCYKKEEKPLQTVHWILIICLSILLSFGILGSLSELVSPQNKRTKLRSVLESFSLLSNGRRLLSAPGGSSAEFRCIHGIRALTMCWVVLGHTYVLLDFELTKDPTSVQNWFSALEFELIHNGWLSVETFFLISGVLVTFGGLKFLQKSKGCFNIPVMAVRRYFRLAPPLLLLMGLVFFLPLLGSGPFWYEHVDPQVDSCTKHWWTTLLFISNWFGIDKGCTLVTWYLAADLQLYILALFFLLVLHRCSKVGVALLVTSVAISCVAVALQTIIHNIMPSAMLSAVDDDKVLDVLNAVHVYTPTHLGPYCIGMAVGYIIFKHREHKLHKALVIVGWCASVVLGLTAVLGVHRFSTGDETSRAMAVLYAAVHRSLFSAAVAWVLYACITGWGGPVNALLSSAILAPFSRLTFMVYLVHPLVIWMRLGCLRERIPMIHYDMLYEYLANLVIAFSVATPFYLLLEAPLTNLERMLNSSSSSKNEDSPPEKHVK